jgi:hypothetical protein
MSDGGACLAEVDRVEGDDGGVRVGVVKEDGGVNGEVLEGVTEIGVRDGEA